MACHCYSGIDGVHSPPTSIVQQNCHLDNQFSRGDEYNPLVKILFQTAQTALPHGFYPLQEFLDIIKNLECGFDRIGVSLLSLNQLELVFTDDNNDGYLYIRSPTIPIK